MIHKWRKGLFLLMIVLFLVLVPQIAQDANYHSFADSRTCLGITHCANVFSNLAFILVAVFSLCFFHINRFKGYDSKNAPDPLLPLKKYLAYTLILVGLGSTYYHLNPENQTLVIDRMAMALCFSALITYFICLTQRLTEYGLLLFFLSLFAIYSVAYWHFSELQGQGDLRLYVIVQFGGIIYMILNLYKLSDRQKNAFILAIVLYGLAKLSEVYDAEIFLISEMISGHSLKHVLAALALLPVLVNSPTSLSLINKANRRN